MTMKVIAMIPVMLSLGSATAAPQQLEHAPTVEQCQADRALWMSQLESDHGTEDVTVLTLQAWEHEMYQCQVVD
jgi:hypothetical protein